MSYPLFDRSALRILPLAERVHDFHLDQVIPLDANVRLNDSADLRAVADHARVARVAGRPVIVMIGAHVIKNGLSRFLIDLMERGYITHIAANGACAIHDYELALIGATTESVARYISTGQFGLWQETGRLNDIIRVGIASGRGIGEAVGAAIEEGYDGLTFPHRGISVLAAGYRLRIPVTVHVSIGYDIIHEHPNCDGAALGAASYHDFLVFAASVAGLQGGVLLSFGTAIMGPEVYLKALAMARNLAHQRGEQINRITTAVFDLQDLGPDLSHTPPKSEPAYYFRPFKTILVRTVQDGGKSYYIRDFHEATLPALHRLLTEAGDPTDNEAIGGTAYG